LKKPVDKTLLKKFLNSSEIKQLISHKYIIVAGSYARGDKIVHDLDILVVKPHQHDLHKVIKNLQGKYNFEQLRGTPESKEINSYLVTDLKTGDHFQLDIRTTTEKELPFKLQYFMGSKSFNIGLRILALAKGYKLSEYDMVNLKTNKPIKIKAEKEIFETLGYKFVPYEKRSVKDPQEAIKVIRATKPDV